LHDPGIVIPRNDAALQEDLFKEEISIGIEKKGQGINRY
jgi:hypothetical protein